VALIRLYTDEQISPALAQMLRARGFDAVTVFDVGMIGKSDPEQLAYAVTEKYTLLTFNVRDFVPLHSEFMKAGQTHSGIILSTQIDLPTLIKRMLNLLNTLTAEEMKNRLEWLNSYL
jgi:predicted nuclease of predicted toxin-antitoxin system